MIPGMITLEKSFCNSMKQLRLWSSKAAEAISWQVNEYYHLVLLISLFIFLLGLGFELRALSLQRGSLPLEAHLQFSITKGKRSLQNVFSDNTVESK
jgi:hypothetical protein